MTVRAVFLTRLALAPTALACIAVLAPATRAQTLEEAERLVAQGDTTGAIAVLESLITRNQRNAEAHYRAGVLRLARADAAGPVSEDRRRAEEHLRYATRFEGDSAKYWLALADFFRSQNLVTLRTQVARLVERARQAAERVGNPPEIAEAEYRTARVAWDRWQQYGRQYRSASVGTPVMVPSVNAEWKDWEQFITQSVLPAPSGQGQQYLAEAENALRRGLAARPLDARLLGLLTVVFGETDRWAEAVALTRKVTRLAPDSGRAWALYGLALARTDRWGDAQDAFRTALERMTPDERAPYQHIGQIMRAADRIRWEQMPDAARASFDSLYWRVAQPLVFTETNELQAEFYARLTYVDHRWTDEWRGYRGWQSDMGAVYVRYGPPDFWSQSVWVYRVTRFRFVFTQMPGFVHAYFADDSREAFRADQTLSPARFDNVPVYRAMDTVPVLTAQFRGPGDSTALAVFGALPLRRMTDSLPLSSLPLVSGALLQDQQGVELLRDRRTETVRVSGETPAVQHRSWRLTMGPGRYVLRVEAHVPAQSRAARGVLPLSIRSFWGSWFMLSDLLIAGRVAPRDSTASRWTDYLLEPNAGWFTQGQSVGLLWEMYNLAADSSGLSWYTVDLRFTIEAVTRRSVFAQIVGGISDAVGLSAEGDDQVAMRYTRSVAATPDHVNVEHLTVELKDAPEGTYTVEVQVTDLLSGRSAHSQQVIHVDRAPPVRCDPCPPPTP